MRLIPKKPTVTLVGVRQAREGFVFIHQGTGSECEGCEYHEVCVKNLETGRVYKIVGVREKTFPCKLHEGGVRVVEVVESDVLTALPSKLAIEGAVITFRRQECDVQACEHFERCVPCGLLDGDRCVIVEAGGNIACLEGLLLVKVVLRRLPAS